MEAASSTVFPTMPAAACQVAPQGEPRTTLTWLMRPSFVSTSSFGFPSFCVNSSMTGTLALLQSAADLIYLDVDTVILCDLLQLADGTGPGDATRNYGGFDSGSACKAHDLGVRSG